MQEKILNSEWTYDAVMNRAREDVESKLPELVARGIDAPIRIGALKIGQRALERLVESNRGRLEALQSSHPIAIGPATLDSLVGAIPDSYECFTGGKMPFENLFFEFIEPLALTIPFGIGETHARGVWFNKSAIDPLDSMTSAWGKILTRGIMPYSATVYFEDASRKLQELTIQFEPTDLTIFHGYSDNLVPHFYADLKLKKILYTTKEEMKNPKPLYRRIFNFGYHHKDSFDSFPNGEFFTLIANLCTNIINYINAQNTTVVKKHRQIDLMVREEDRKRRKVKRQVPYYIVDVQSRIVYDKQVPTGQTWTLTERMYTRGHNRHYRDDDGKISYVRWIAPFIRGPEGAPWKDQRHRVLGEKLDRERAYLMSLPRKYR